MKAIGKKDIAFCLRALLDVRWVVESAIVFIIDKTVGKGSVIGTGAVVIKNIPPYSVAVGIPAKVIRRNK